MCLCNRDNLFLCKIKILLQDEFVLYLYNNVVQLAMKRICSFVHLFKMLYNIGITMFK